MQPVALTWLRKSEHQEFEHKKHEEHSVDFQDVDSDTPRGVLHHDKLATTVSEMETPGETCCCFDLRKLSRTCNTTWFLMACCGFVVISSLPRTLTILDAVFTVVMYFTAVKNGSPITADKTAVDFVSDDMEAFAFEFSVIDVVILSILRSVLLFWVMAYRYHLHKYIFRTSTSVMVVCGTYLIIKLSLLDASESHAIGLIVYAIVMNFAEYMVYMGVRRRRIRVPDRGGFESAVSSPQRVRVAVKSPRVASGTQPLLPGARRSSLNTSAPSSPKLGSSPAAPPTALVPAGGGDALELDELISPDSLFTEDALRVHYKFRQGAGDSSCVSVVLMHGFGGSVYSWDECLERLAASTKISSILAFDRPGFGLTSRPVPYGASYGTFSGGGWRSVDENPYTVEFAINLLVRMMRHLNISRAVLVGHNTGGALAIRACLEHPQLFVGAFCISPTIFSQGFPNLVRSIFHTRLGKQVVLQLVRSEIGEVAIRRAWYEPHNIPPHVLQRYKNLLRVRNWNEALTEMAGTKDVSKVSDRLDEVKFPVRILHGENDKLIPFADSVRVVEELRAVGADVALIRIEKCGHVPHEEFPHIFLGHLDDFLSHLSYGRTITLLGDSSSLSSSTLPSETS